MERKPTVLLIDDDSADRELIARMLAAKYDVLQALAQKLEAIGQLAAGIEHEINTPSQYVSDNITFLAATASTPC